MHGYTCDSQHPGDPRQPWKDEADEADGGEQEHDDSALCNLRESRLLKSYVIPNAFGRNLPGLEANDAKHFLPLALRLSTRISNLHQGKAKPSLCAASPDAGGCDRICLGVISFPLAGLMMTGYNHKRDRKSVV